MVDDTRRPDSIHCNVCPDCGAADSGHGLDPAAHCPHQFECFVPVEFVPAERLDRLEEALRFYGDEQLYFAPTEGDPMTPDIRIREEAPNIREAVYRAIRPDDITEEAVTAASLAIINCIRERAGVPTIAQLDGVSANDIVTYGEQARAALTAALIDLPEGTE